MILESVELAVRPGQEAAFEAAFAQACPLIEASPGFHGIALLRPAEPGGPYLLQVKWRSIADHRNGFRTSDRYQEWRRLLHHFYDPMPYVRYFDADAVGR